MCRNRNSLLAPERLKEFMNLYKTSVFSLALITIFAVAIQAQNNLPAKDIEAIKSVQETYRAAWLKNDEKTVLSLFTETATLYPNGNKPVKGKDEITKFWFAASDTVTTINSFEIKIEDLTGNKNLAVLTGSNALQWTSEKKDKSETKRFVSKGYFISIYVKRGADWKILSQLWNAKTEEIR
jgi:uncharacterized protein (TIGR02246 family)